MATQKQVGGIALGVPGTLYGHNPATFYLPTPIAGAGGVTIGNFDNVAFAAPAFQFFKQNDFHGTSFA